MTRLRVSTVLRRFLDGDSLEQLADACGPADDLGALRYVEHCIRRGLRGEVRIPATRQSRQRRLT